MYTPDLLRNAEDQIRAVAVEVYPKQSDIFDGADAYHLWVLPDGLGFSIGDPVRLEKHGAASVATR